MSNSNLFDKDGAIFSECRRYRYALFRQWNLEDPILMFIGLNPSTANEHDNDPTIRRVIKFAFDWGYGGVSMLNLFPLVSSNPSDLLDFYNTPFHDLALEENNKYLERCFDKCSELVFAWGAFKQAEKRAEEVIKMFPNALCLGKNMNGSPKHPLYIPASTQPIKF